MFKLIEPKDQRFNKVLVNSFLEIVKANQVLSRSFQDHKNATLIVTNDATRGICGGALLLKQGPVALYKKIGKKMNTFAPPQGETWSCTVYLHMEKRAFAADFESFCKSFYHQLYEKLVEFGANKGTGYLCMMLEPGEYLCTEVMGLWPYVLEVRPQESLDGLFHGVLSVSMRQPNTQKSAWERLPSQGKKLAA